MKKKANEIYGIHPSKKLNDIFKEKPFQGQNPKNAKFIFLGIDANFSKTIENENKKFSCILEYLDDGPAFWKKHGVHHPFLLDGFGSLDGVKYHKNFYKIYEHDEVPSILFDKVSFVELVKYPTFGKYSKSYLTFRELLCKSQGHLEELNKIFLNDNFKIIFIPRGVVSIVRRYRNAFQGLNFFKMICNFRVNRNEVSNPIICTNNTTAYIITHFSDAISNEHISNIRRIIDSNIQFFQDKVVT